jgi:hypothetical protein
MTNLYHVFRMIDRSDPSSIRFTIIVSSIPTTYIDPASISFWDAPKLGDGWPETAVKSFI